MAERALWLWNNDFFIQLAVRDDYHRREILGILHGALSRNEQDHWHESVKQLSSHVLSLYVEEDPVFVGSLRTEELDVEDTEDAPEAD